MNSQKSGDGRNLAARQVPVGVQQQGQRAGVVECLQTVGVKNVLVELEAVKKGTETEVVAVCREVAVAYPKLTLNEQGLVTEKLRECVRESSGTAAWNAFDQVLKQLTTREPHSEATKQLLECAKVRNFEGVVEALAKGADVYAKDSTGKSAMLHAMGDDMSLEGLPLGKDVKLVEFLRGVMRGQTLPRPTDAAV